MDKPLKEHFEMDNDFGTMLSTFEFIKAQEKYIDYLENLLNKERNNMLIELNVDLEIESNKYKIKDVYVGLNKVSSIFGEPVRQYLEMNAEENKERNQEAIAETRQERFIDRYVSGHNG